MEAKMMLRVREVANEVDVHELTVRRWIADGRLEAVRLGTGERAAIRVPAVSVWRFLEDVRPVADEGKAA